MMLYFKQKMFAWFGAFTIFDEEGETVYTVKGKPALGHKLLIYDSQGNELGVLREELLHMMPHYKVTIGGEEVGEIRGRMAFMKQKFELDFCGWEVAGNFRGWDYQVKDASGSLRAPSRSCGT